MSAKPIIVQGDDVAISVTLKKNDATFDMATATVKAAITDTSSNTILVGPSVQNPAANGANWTSSVVVIEFTDTETNTLTYFGNVKIEIEVLLTGKYTTFFLDAKTIPAAISNP